MPELLTNRIINGLDATEKQYSVSDSRIPNLQIVVNPGGRKTWTYRYRSGSARKRVTIGTYPAIKVDQARNIALAYSNNVSTGKIREASHTLQELFDFYYEVHAKPSKRTHAADIVNFEKWWKKFGQTDIGRLKKSEIALRLGEIRKQNGDSAHNKARALLSKMYSIAIEYDWHDLNPVSGTKRVALDPRKRFLRPTEVKAFFDAIMMLQREVMRDYFVMLFATGQRRTMVARMQWDHVDLENRIWMVPREESKSKKPQTFALGELALQLLRKRLTARTDGEIWVFPGQSKEGHINDPKYAITRIRELSGIPDVTIHDIRRTVGSWATRGGLSLKKVQLLMGHSNVGITAEHYAHLELDDSRNDINFTVDSILQHADYDVAK